MPTTVLGCPTKVSSILNVLCQSHTLEAVSTHLFQKLSGNKIRLEVFLEAEKQTWALSDQAETKGGANLSKYLERCKPRF